jgi:hypothetical protein
MSIRRLSRADVLSAVVPLLVVACIGPDPDSATTEGEAGAAANKPPATNVPFTSTLLVSRHLESRDFIVPAHATITVTEDGHWDRPAPCGGPTYTVTLFRKFLGLVPQDLGARAHVASGVTHTEVWSNVAGGTYFLEIHTAQDNPGCNLIGSISVKW